MPFDSPCVGFSILTTPLTPNPSSPGINVANINFWTCKKIRDVLTSDKDTAAKNWLGQYKSQATKDWEVPTTFSARNSL